jgi:gliding motility-associated-like protein
MNLRFCLTLAFLSSICFDASAQTVLYNGNFETPFVNWLSAGTTTPNAFIRSTCAGNGSTAVGSQALYISKGGTISGCGATGMEQFAYANSSGSVQECIAYVSIDATCASNLQAAFDYRIQGITNEDIGQLIFSTDNGLTWLQQGSNLSPSLAWTTTTIALPAGLNFSSFLVGVRFIYNGSNVTGIPLAIDNFRITGTDSQAPVISSCPGNATLPVNSSCQLVLPSYTAQVTATDNCPGALTFTQNPPAGTLLSGAGSTTPVTISVSDAGGNSVPCTFTITLSDTTRPVFACPGSQSVGKNAQCEAFIPNFQNIVTPTDNCTASAALVYNQIPATGTVLTVSTPVTISYTDAAGNARTCTLNAFPVDNTPPNLTCPVSQTVSTNNGCNYTLPNWGNQAQLSDNCSANNNMIINQTPAIGTIHPIGPVTITLNVSDQFANSTSCSFQLTVADGVDPVVTCPPNQEVQLNSVCSGLLGNYVGLASASDNCSAASTLTFSQQPAPGGSISMNTTITIIATDPAGNQGLCSFTALAIDTINPTISCPDTIEIAINPTCSYAIPDIGSQMIIDDNCISASNLAIVQNPLPGTNANGIVPVTSTVYDQQGNNATCVSIFVPIDISPAGITCPFPMSVSNGLNCSYVLPNYTSQAIVTDDCPDYVVTQNPSPGTVVTNGLTAITLSVIDAGGNNSSCSFNLQVDENINPVISCPASISTCDSIISYVLPTYSDNCEASLNQIDGSGLGSGSVFPVGITTLTYQAIDSAGNTATCSFSIERKESPSPAVISQDTLYLCDVTSGVLQAAPIVYGVGTWSLIEGIATFNNPLSSITGVNNLLSDTVIVSWTVSTATCGLNADTLVIIISEAPLPTETLDTLMACNDIVVNLFGDAPLIGIGTWSTSSGASILDEHSPISQASNFDPGWSSFIWTISNGNCPATSDTLHLFATPPVSINQADTILCLGSEISLSGSELVDLQTASWSFYEGSGNFSAPNETSTNVNEFSLGISTIIYEAEHPQCPSMLDTIAIAVNVCDGVNPILPTVFTPNSDGENDLFMLNYLEQVYPNLHLTVFNRWGDVVFESVGYTEPWNGTRNGEELPIGAYYYKLELMDTSSTIINGSISLIR